MEKKTIKIAEGVRVITSTENVIFEDNQELWKALKIDSPEYDEARINIIRELICFGRIDLTPAYGQTVILEIVPVKEA